MPDIELFKLLAELRGASAESLHVLHYRGRGISFRTTMRRLASLLASGHLARVRLHSSRSIYHLTTTSLRALAHLHVSNDCLRRKPAARQAAFCWLRASLRAALIDDGYMVGCGVTEVHQLRRFLVDGQAAVLRETREENERIAAETTIHLLRTHGALQAPVRSVCDRCGWRGPFSLRVTTCGRCGRTTRGKLCTAVYRCGTCGARGDVPGEHLHGSRNEPCAGTLRPISALPFDVAWRKVKGGREVIVVFVDNPSRSLKVQLDALPHGLPGGLTLATKVPVIVRSVEPDSHRDRETGEWLSVAPRHRELLRAFATGGALAASAIVVNLYPALQVNS